MFRFSLALGLCLLAGRAFAFDSSLVHNAGVYGEAKRYTYEQYAARKGLGPAAILQRYASTSVLRCNGRQATAQLTGANNIISTAGHLFNDRDTCRKISEAKDCEFSVTTLSGIKKYKVAELLATGSKCPENGGKFGDDWAVLRLRENVRDVTPYKLPMTGDIPKEDESVVAVSGAARDFFLFDSRRNKYYPRTIEDCSVKYVRPVSGDGSYAETDCDAAELSSGGSLLRSSKTGDVLIGIHMGSFELAPMLEKALAEKRVNQRPYEHGVWASIYVSVDGKFLKALEEAAGLGEKI